MVSDIQHGYILIFVFLLAAAVTSVSLDSLDSVLYISTAKRTLGDGA